jgi:hypothetical protein
MCNTCVHSVNVMWPPIIIIIIIVVVVVVTTYCSCGGSSTYTSTDKTNKNKYT